ncbi:butanoate--CoA ligase AAE1-like [Actinidia eriantha]|uniref:butanoate--CoA ligase AAE1-like n=1 Tax=Actinidia eriantha TaxID=165200 RepID=UPI0025839CF9|nr:butanoate--CoA ligase AAE1-like [Actinidia eriantha]
MDDEMEVLRDKVEQITLADPKETENTKPLEEVVPISIHPDYPDRHVMIGTELTDKLRSALTDFLRKNFDIFAWSQGDVPGIDPQVATQSNYCGCCFSPKHSALYELHFGVPMSAAVLCTLNIRHDSKMFSVLTVGAIEILSKTSTNLPQQVLVLESDKSSPTATKMVSTNGNLEYERLIAKGQPDFEIKWPNDKWDSMLLNYTSGTTSSPKGVIYSHRGAYLNSLAAVLLNEMPSMPVCLWTVSMFHCNDWCLTWAVAAQGGTNVCLRTISAKVIFDCVSQNKVIHMGGAPTVLNMTVNAGIKVKPNPTQPMNPILYAHRPLPPLCFRMQNRKLENKLLS